MSLQARTTAQGESPPAHVPVSPLGENYYVGERSRRIWKDLDYDLDLPKQLLTFAPYTTRWEKSLEIWAGWNPLFPSAPSFCWSNRQFVCVQNRKKSCSCYVLIIFLHFGVKNPTESKQLTCLVPQCGNRRCVPRHLPVMPNPPVVVAGGTCSQAKQIWGTSDFPSDHYIVLYP